MTSEEQKKHLLKTLGKEISTIVEKVIAKRDEATQKSIDEAKAKSMPEALSKAIANPKTGGAEDTRGFKLAQVVRSMAAGKGDVYRAAKFAEKNYGAEHAVTKMLSSDVTENGGALVPINTDSQIIELLRPASAVRSLNPVLLPLPNGNMTMPKMKGGASANYVGEKSAIPTSKPKTGSVRLVAKKLAALVPVTNDLIRYTGPQTDAVIRDDAVSALGTRSDQAFIRGNGGEFSPTGIRHLALAANIITANATINLVNITADLSKLILAIWGKDSRMLRPGWIFSPRSVMTLMTIRDDNGNFAFKEEMLSGKLWGFPFKATTSVPINLGSGADTEVSLADFADLMLAENQNIIVDVSTEGVYTDENNQVISAFQNDLTLVRLIQLHDFQTRHQESLAVLTAVKW